MRPPSRRSRRRPVSSRTPLVLGVLALLASGLCPAPTRADRVYWANTAGGTAPKISFAALDGSGGGDLDTSGAAAACCPGGVAIDTAAGRIYWGNDGANTISFADLDGGGGGDLPTTGATVDGPYGVAIDPAGGRIYWTNGNAIAFARLDGSGGDDLDVGTATLAGPQGIAVDPAAGRVYWANSGSGGIAFARTDGSGGGDLDTTGLMLGRPEGVALDVAAGRAYFADYDTDTIGYVRLDGSGGALLSTPGATVADPWGMAVDVVAGRVYWSNYGGDRVSFARVDGIGGGDVVTIGATVAVPNSAAILHAPRGTGAPTISGGAAPGATLACTGDAWEGDVIASHLYRGPTSVAYQWLRDGTEIPGATGLSVVADAFGEYRCRATARNAAGATSQTSAPLASPTADAFDFAPDVFPVAKRATTVAPEGSFTFALGGPAAVQITIERKRPRNRFQLRGTLTAAGQAGANTLAFSGRLDGKPLPKGRYRALLMVSNAAGTVAPLETTFRVVRARKRSGR